MAEEKTVITLICERAAEVDSVMADDNLKDQPNVKVVKFPCSGMIQPKMVEAAIKAGASGVVVCGCQIGDCYYREGNKMIKERLMGGRPPGLKKFVDRRRVLALWLSRKQTDRFLSETKEFVSYVDTLDKEEKPKEEAKSKPSPKPAPAKKEDKPKEPAKAEKKADEKPKEEKKASKEDKKPAAKSKSEDKDKKGEDKSKPEDKDKKKEDDKDDKKKDK